MSYSIYSCSCSVKSCKNSYAKTKHRRIKYFRFPKDPEIVTEWVKACNQETINLKHARVCSVHFKEDCFVKKSDHSVESGVNDILTLTKLAVPTEQLTDDKDASNKRKQTVLDDDCDFDELECKLNKWGATIIDLWCNKNDNNTSRGEIHNRVSDSSSSALNSSVNLTNANEDHSSKTECNENDNNTSQDNHCCEFKKLEHKLSERGVTIADLRCNKNDNNTLQGEIQNRESESPSTASNSCVHLRRFHPDYRSRTEEQILLNNHFDVNKLERKLSEQGVTLTDLRCNKNDNNTSQGEIQNCVSDSSSRALNSSVNLTNTYKDHCLTSECNENDSNTSQDEIQNHVSDSPSSASNSSVYLTYANRNHCSSTPEKRSNCEISESRNENIIPFLETEIYKLKIENKFLERHLDTYKAVNEEIKIADAELRKENLTLRQIVLELKASLTQTRLRNPIAI